MGLEQFPLLRSGRARSGVGERAAASHDEIEEHAGDSSKLGIRQPTRRKERDEWGTQSLSSRVRDCGRASCPPKPRSLTSFGMTKGKVVAKNATSGAPSDERGTRRRVGHPGSAVLILPPTIQSPCGTRTRAHFPVHSPALFLAETRIMYVRPSRSAASREACS